MKTALAILVGVGILTGILALFLLFRGEWGASFGTLVTSLGFLGLAWAGRRLLLPKPDGSPRQAAAQVIGVVFGGAGSLMLVGGLLFLVEGDFGAAAGLGVFGLVFCGAAYTGWRVFSLPRGKREILVGQGTRTIPGVPGQEARLTGGTYVCVDQDTPDAEIERMRQDWAEKPWTQRQDWAEGMVIQEGAGSLRLLIGLTVLWNVIAWALAAYGISSERDSGDVPWFLLVFPACGIFLATVTARTWMRRRKFGISILCLESMPALPGDRLRGTVRTGVRVKGQTDLTFLVRLVCVRRSSFQDREGKQRVTEERIWSEEHTGFGTVSGPPPAFEIPVDVPIPADLPPTELHPEDDRTLWRLEISAKVRGVDYAARFEVPVFRGN